ncbi:AAA family ATPase [Methylobacterium durans]|uniref:AAA family ATPase n=1 Tax=Methylobacterium durans TaxID=2202825 RepID=UPI0013A58921|nr:AAA family ATPase [Methylobacterium durans]
MPVAYTGPAGALDPFDPEHLSEPLFWPEGEKDVDTLAAANAFAFTFGGSNDVPDEAARLVVGRDVFVLADNDEPGRKCATRKAALARRGQAASVRVVHFPELPLGGDVSEWLEQGHGTVDDLLSRAEHPATEASREPANLSRAPPLPSASTISRWIGVEPAQTRFVVDPIVPRAMVTLCAADGGSGKTLLGQHMLTCCASGQPFLGLPVETGAVAGLFGEDPDQILHARQLRICRELGLTLEQLEERLRISSYLGTDFALWRRVALTEFFSELEEDLRRISNLALVVIDNASLAFIGNENDRSEVATFMAQLNGLASRLNAAILLLSHTSKSQGDGSANMASGSTAWVWQARSALRLKSLGSEGRVELQHLKSNYAKAIGPVVLRWSDTGVLTRDPETRAEARAGGVKLGQRAQLALVALREVLLNFGELAPAGLQIPYGHRVAKYEHWRAKLQRVLCRPGDDPGEPRFRKALERVVKELQGTGIVGRDNPYVWIAREPNA